ncbi:hypothetical protein M758_1G183000 [Ceratodon purpureus]|nr:hypothetical protein M758_1G183000 [Ceratodon purpureus]
MPSCSVHRLQLITLQGCVHGGHGRVYALRRICGREVHHVLGCWTHESTLISCGSMRASSAVALQQSLSDFLSRIACRYEEGADLKLTISFSGFRGGHCREKKVCTACRERSLQSFPLWESQRNLGL